MVRLRLDRNDTEPRVPLLEAARHAHERPAGAERQDQPVDPPPRLPPHFLRGPFVVRAHVVRVDVLSDPEVRPGVLGVQAIRQVPRLVGPPLRGREHDRGPQRPQDLAPLHRHFLRYGDDDRITLHRAHHRHADARVPARGLEKRHARLQLPAPLRLLDDAQRDPLLDAAHRIEPFDLGEEDDARLRVQPADAHERRVADGLENAVADGTDVHGGGIIVQPPRTQSRRPRARPAGEAVRSWWWPPPIGAPGQLEPAPDSTEHPV